MSLARRRLERNEFTSLFELKTSFERL